MRYFLSTIIIVSNRDQIINKFDGQYYPGLLLPFDMMDPGINRGWKSLVSGTLSSDWDTAKRTENEDKQVVDGNKFDGQYLPWALITP